MLKEEIKEKATKLKDKENEFTHVELLSCAGTKLNFKDCFTESSQQPNDVGVITPIYKDTVAEENSLSFFPSLEVRGQARIKNKFS